MPIITCSGKRKGAVAREITDKGYCSTKNMYYHGLKLHALAYRRPNHLPFPESIVVTPSSENDLNAFKQNWNNIPNRVFYGEKIYHDTEFFDNTKKIYNSKSIKGMFNYRLAGPRLWEDCSRLYFSDI